MVYAEVRWLTRSCCKCNGSIVTLTWLIATLKCNGGRGGGYAEGRWSASNNEYKSKIEMSCLDKIE